MCTAVMRGGKYPRRRGAEEGGEAYAALTTMIRANPLPEPAGMVQEM